MKVVSVCLMVTLFYDSQMFLMIFIWTSALKTLDSFTHIHTMKAETAMQSAKCHQEQYSAFYPNCSCYKAANTETSRTTTTTRKMNECIGNYDKSALK